MSKRLGGILVCKDKTSLLMSGVSGVGFPHSCNGKSLSGDRTHTREVVLCWALVEQARHEHMPDEYKKRYYLVYY